MSGIICARARTNGWWLDREKKAYVILIRAHTHTHRHVTTAKVQHAWSESLLVGALTINKGSSQRCAPVEVFGLNDDLRGKRKTDDVFCVFFYLSFLGFATVYDTHTRTRIFKLFHYARVCVCDHDHTRANNKSATCHGFASWNYKTTNQKKKTHKEHPFPPGRRIQNVCVCVFLFTLAREIP